MADLGDQLLQQPQDDADERDRLQTELGSPRAEEFDEAERTRLADALAAAQSQRAALESTRDRLLGALARTQARRDEMSMARARTERELAASRAELATEIARHEAELAASRAELAKEIARYETELAKYRDAQMQNSDDIARTRPVAERENERSRLAALESTRDRLLGALARAQGRRDDIAMTLAQTQRELTESRADGAREIERRDAELAECRAELAREIERRDAELAECRAELAREIECRERESAVSRAELVECRADLAKETERRQGLEAERNALFASRSWRVTAPLRAAADRARRFKQR
jgi:chromosome segregation ATPase